MAADFWAEMRWSVLLCEMRMDEFEVFQVDSTDFVDDDIFERNFLQSSPFRSSTYCTFYTYRLRNLTVSNEPGGDNLRMLSLPRSFLFHVRVYKTTTPSQEIWNEGQCEKDDPFWKEYLDEAAAFDVRMVDEWNKTIDVLVYVGYLFVTFTIN